MEHKQRVIVEDIATTSIFQGSPAREVMLAAGACTVQSTPLLTRAGAVLGMLSTHSRTPRRPSGDELRLIDLCARQAADLIEQEWVEARLTTSLQEKEVLLREIHHRVKNNLQVVCSLLSLQRHSIQDRSLQELFQESEHCICTMALIHEALYQANDMARFTLAPYLSTLGDYLLRSYGIDTRRITLRTQLDDVALPLETAVPLGLLVHELLSNVLKHSFPHERRGASGSNSGRSRRGR